MRFKKTNKGYIIRLLKNENLIEELTNFCNENAIQSGIFYGIGAVLDAELGFYHLDKKEYEFKKLNKPLEIVSLTGNIALVDNKPFLHIHTVLSDIDFSCMGGHLKNAIVGATCEVFLFDFEEDIERIYDEDIGLKLLNCDMK